MNVPRGLFFAGAVFASCFAFAASEPFGFKGIDLGSGIEPVASNPKYDCRSASAPGSDTICSLRAQEKETIAGAPIRSLFFFYYDGKLTGIAIHLEEKNFAQVVEALRGKYGEARLEREAIRNLKGVGFENRAYTWTGQGATLMARRYSGRLDLSSIRFSADELIHRIEQRKAAVAKDPGKDL